MDNLGLWLSMLIGATLVAFLCTRRGMYIPGRDTSHKGKT